MDDHQRADEMAEKLRTALAMFGLGESIMRQNLRRTYPDASEAEIETRVRAWLSRRTGGPYGDASDRWRDRLR